MTIQMGRLLAIATAFQVLGLFFATSSGIHAAENTAPLSEANQYGTPGPNKILVAIKGQVARPGRYYVERGVTLSELPKLAGGLKACPDCKSLPKTVTLFSETDPNGKRDYRLADPKLLGTVHLNEGDRVSFWHFRL